MAKRREKKSRPAADPGGIPAGQGTRDGGGSRWQAGPAAEIVWQEAGHTGHATAKDGGTAVSGIYNHYATVHLPVGAVRKPAEVDAPATVGNLPYRPESFVGRERELDQLDSALRTPGAAWVQVVHGLGGIGKSALAAHWAATRPHGHAPVRWIVADCPAGVQQGLASFAVALQPVLGTVLTQEGLAEYAMEWLATHPGWLLVLDNVDDPDHIADLIGKLPGGRFLITSRRSHVWTGAATPVRLDTPDPAESLDLFTRRVTQAGPRDLGGAAELCEELGHLPLAVDQAGTFLGRNPLLTLRGYLEMLAVADSAEVYGRAESPTQALLTISKVWRVTLDRLHALHPVTTDMLRTLAWYAPERIPAALAGADADPAARATALDLLNDYSMITLDPATGTLAVHRLVQALARTPDEGDPHRTPDLIDRARRLAAGNLGRTCPADCDDPATWPAWRALLPHFDALVSRAPADTDTAETVDVIGQTALFLRSQGLIVDALPRLRRALDGSERVLGADHPDTLGVRNSLAVAYESAGELHRAVPLLEQVHKDAVRVLGKQHAFTLVSRNNLASAYRSAGDLRRAIPLIRQALEDQLRSQGEDHPDTALLRSNLAYAYESIGDLGRAVPLLELTLRDRVRVLGKKHPDTLTSRNSLAYIYRAVGDTARAIPLFERTLKDRVRVLGKDHPDVLSTRSDLATAHSEAGDQRRAIPLFERTLEDRTRVLGTDHPHTLASRNNLANAWLAAGDIHRALLLHEQAHADTERVLGKDHPVTLTTRHTLADACQAAGDLRRAFALLDQTLKDRVRVLGKRHPDTLTTRNRLADACREAGDARRALFLLTQTVKDRIQVSGRDHPYTLTARNDLALAYQTVGDLRRAVPLHEQALADTERVLGKAHPSTLTSRNNLANAYQAAGDPQRAVQLLEQCAKDLVKVVGKDHPNLLRCNSNLATAYQSTGELRRAIALFEQTLGKARKLLGEEHPTTAWVRENLAVARAAREPGT
ncbi:tetratricopeptide repeat protein [Streptomyces sp. 21So2-11]|uniref:tetratricopeptide repeat protein n=1 Tax=Streptomyces sp. 21So2-11 TaxID=3144408 RepID=UPI00321B1234